MELRLAHLITSDLSASCLDESRAPADPMGLVPIMYIMTFSLRVSQPPDKVLGRTVTTMRSFNRAIMVVVAPLGGLLAVQAGNRVALGIAALVFTVAVAMLIASPFRGVRSDQIRTRPP